MKKNDMPLNEALSENVGETLLKERGGKGKVAISRIHQLIKPLELWKKQDLLRWLEKEIRKAKRQDKKLGVKRKQCAGCGKFYFRADKYIKHISECETYIELAKNK